VQKSSRSFGDLIHSQLKCGFVCLRRFAEAADFPHELQRGIPNFFRCHRRIEVEENFDIPAHSVHLKCESTPYLETDKASLFLPKQLREPYYCMVKIQNERPFSRGINKAATRLRFTTEQIAAKTFWAHSHWHALTYLPEGC
jgi:hypothetical protein